MQQRGKDGGFSLSRVLQGSISLIVVCVVFFYVLPRVVDYDDVGAAIGAMTWLEVVTLAALAIWNQFTYVLLEVSARPGLSHWQALQITLTSTAISNTLPAGAALGVGVQTAMYVSYGFPKQDITLSMLVTGLSNTFVKLAMPIVALGLLVVAGQANGGLVAISLIGLAVFVAAVLLLGMALKSERGALTAGRAVGRMLAPVLRLLRRPPNEDWGPALVDFRRRTIELLRARWPRIVTSALISHITLYLVLLLALRHVGISNSEVSWQEALAAFAFVRLISVIPVTPGGLGVVELGTTAVLVAAGGDRAQVVAAVLVFRLLTFVLPIPFGASAYLVWRKGATARALAKQTA